MTDTRPGEIGAHDVAETLTYSANMIAADRDYQIPSDGPLKPGMDRAEKLLRRMADEAQQQETAPAAHHPAVPAGAVCKCPGDCGHQLTAEAQQECNASISGSCLRESQSETACDTEAGECVGGGRPADEAQQQPDTETPALPEDEPTESVIYQVVGDWGVDSADSAEGARAAVAKWLRAYPKCGAFAQQRIVRDWPDGSEFYGPWTALPDAAAVVSQPGKEG